MGRWGDEPGGELTGFVALIVAASLLFVLALFTVAAMRQVATLLFRGFGMV